MNNKRGFVDRQSQRPANKRNRYIDSHQPLPHPPHHHPHHHHHQKAPARHLYSHYSPEQPSYDTADCLQHLERLSLSRDNHPPWKGPIPETRPITPSSSEDQSSLHSSKPWVSSHKDPHSVNQNHTLKDGRLAASQPQSLPSNPIHHPLPLNSFQPSSDWTQVVRKGIPQQGSLYQPPFKRDPWTRGLPQPHRPSNYSQSFIPNPSRSIAGLPKRASVISPNTFAILSSHSMNEDPSNLYSAPSCHGPSHTTSGHKTSKRDLRKSQKKSKKLVPIIIDEDKQIDIVLDTNILLSYLHFLRAVIPLLSPTCRILVPQAVVLELDMQKNRQHPVEVYEAGRCSSLHSMGSLARQATNWLLKTTKSHSSNVLIQKIDEEAEEVKRSKDADSRILSYAHNLFLQAKSEDVGAVTALLSNDNILRLRAQSEGICCLAMSDFHHSPRQMISNIRNFVARPSVSKPLAPTDPRPLDPSPPVLDAPIEKSKLTQKPKQSPMKSWLPSAKDAQFTFTSLLPNINKPNDPPESTGPDQELNRLKYHIQKPRICMGCQSDIQSTLQVSPDRVHHYCPMCCEVICRGCMRVTGCDWDCAGPFYGKACATMKCCAEGRAAVLLESLGQLDCYFLTNNHKVSFKDGPKIAHLYGDEALVHYLQATIALLKSSGEDDERLGFLSSILISSTLLDVLSQTLLSSPFIKWHFRSNVFMNAIKLVKTILRRHSRPWMILNSEYSKSSTTGLLSVNHGQHGIVWKRVIEASNQPNATQAKVDELRKSFPSLMADVKDILCNRPGSSSTIIQKLLDNTVHVPLCYILDSLFESCLKMKTSQLHPSSSLGDIELMDPFPNDLVPLKEALLDLKKIYRLNLITEAPHSNTKSDQDGHDRNFLINSDDEESDDIDVKANNHAAKQKLNANDEVYIYAKDQQLGEDPEVEPVQDDVRKKKIIPSKEAKHQVNGKGYKSTGDAKSQGDDVRKKKIIPSKEAKHQVNGKGYKSTGDAKSQGARVAKKDTEGTCPVKNVFDKIDTLSILSDEDGSDNDTIEVIHLN